MTEIKHGKDGRQAIIECMPLPKKPFEGSIDLQKKPVISKQSK